MSKKEKKHNNEYQENLEGRNYSEEEYDKLTVYLASGAIVVSVSFIDKLIQIGSTSTIWMLKLSWILFTLTLLIILISHKTSLSTFDNRIMNKEKASKRFECATRILNWLAFGTLTIGLVFFGIFVLINI